MPLLLIVRHFNVSDNSPFRIRKDYSIFPMQMNVINYTMKQHETTDLSNYIFHQEIRYQTL